MLFCKRGTAFHGPIIYKPRFFKLILTFLSCSTVCIVQPVVALINFFEYMTTVDVIILILLVVGIVRGVLTGGIKQVLSFVGVVLGLLLAVSLSEPVSKKLVELNWSPEGLAPALSFIIIFFLVQGLVLIVTHFLKSVLEKIKLGGLDKALGGIMGGGKAILVISLILFLVRFIGIPGEEQRDSSFFYDIIYPITPATWDFVVGNAPELSDFDSVDD